MKKAIFVFIAIVIASLSVWADEPSFADDGYYHYYKIVGLRLDKTGIEGVKELNNIRLIINANIAPSDISRWRLVIGQESQNWPEITISGSKPEPTGARENGTGMTVDLGPTLELKSPLKINSGEVQIVSEGKIEGKWQEVKKINLIIKEVIEESPRFL